MQEDVRARKGVLGGNDLALETLVLELDDPLLRSLKVLLEVERLVDKPGGVLVSREAQREAEKRRTHLFLPASEKCWRLDASHTVMSSSRMRSARSSACLS